MVVQCDEERGNLPRHDIVSAKVLQLVITRMEYILKKTHHLLEMGTMAHPCPRHSTYLSRSVQAMGGGGSGGVGGGGIW